MKKLTLLVILLISIATFQQGCEDNRSIVIDFNGLRDTTGDGSYHDPHADSCMIFGCDSLGNVKVDSL